MIRTVAGFQGHCNVCHGPGDQSKLSFHTAEKLVCGKCHTMHYSEDGTIPAGADTGGPFGSLLLKASTTDLCLVCHQAPLNSTGAPIVMTTDGSMGTSVPNLPGGDYYYSKNDDGMGHNPGGTIGYDSMPIPPGDGRGGGAFSSADESCVSCHEPHGGSPANSYRLLRKRPKGWTGPDIIVVAGYESHPGSDEGTPVTTKAPGPKYFYPPNGSTSGFAYWCGACHSNPDNSVDGTGFHGSAKNDSDVGDDLDWVRHPSDRALGSVMASNYTAASSYDWQYPVSVVDVDGTVDSDSQVFCLSCHRAHATEHANSTRWDNGNPSGYGMGCNKCHDKG